MDDRAGHIVVEISLHRFTYVHDESVDFSTPDVFELDPATPLRIGSDFTDVVRRSSGYQRHGRGCSRSPC
jgi:hypothetical protein